MKHVTVVQHTHSEWLGLIEDHLEGRSIRFGYVRPFVGAALPQPDLVGAGLILLGGGPFGTATAGHMLPGLEAEVRLARACLLLDTPVLGLGVGAQILSLAADGGAEPAPLAFEVGEARRVSAQALDGFLPERFPSVVYMRDRPLPPAYAQVLALDEADRPALFQIGARAFGFSGHPGIKPAIIEDLVMEFDEGPAGDVAATLTQLRDRQRLIEDALVAIMTGLVRRTGWMG